MVGKLEVRIYVYLILEVLVTYSVDLLKTQ